MKLRLICTTALFAMAGAAPVLAQTTSADPQYAYPGERIYVPAVRPGSAIHGGWVAPGDEQLLGDVVAAFSADRNLDNMTVTIVAKNGELIINGIAKNVGQAAYAERIAKRIANGHVTAQWDTQIG